MKDNTVKLSGHAKDRFIERFFGEEAALDDETRKRLVLRSQSAFSSLRIRKALLSRRPIAAKPSPLVQKRASTGAVGKATPTAAPALETPAPAASPAPPPAAGLHEPSANAAFDPYAFGLVPVFQREGAEGLLAKLAGVALVEQLRAMAKSQQIVLPQDLRSGEASAEAIRTGIVEAVGKRIKDRRAAAG